MKTAIVLIVMALILMAPATAGVLDLAAGGGYLNSAPSPGYGLGCPGCPGCPGTPNRPPGEPICY